MADTSGAELCERVVKSLSDNGIDIKWLVGQGYDGASNVRGKCQGLKTRIQSLNKKAIYVWCYGHRFNLVLEATASCCLEVKNTFDLLEELYVFFSGHKRNAVFLNAQSESSKRQLKRVSSTRWVSKESAVETTIVCFEAILEALDTLLETASDSATRTSATGLSKRVRDFEFIVILLILRDIFNIAGPVSKQLQGISLDLSIASQVIKSCREKFFELRADGNMKNSWKTVLENAKAFASRFGIDTIISEKRRKKKRMYDEKCNDEALVGEDKLRVDVYVRVLDEICMQLDDRFSNEQTDLMLEIALFSSFQLRKCEPINEESVKILCLTYNLDSTEIVSEYNEFIKVYNILSCHHKESSHIDTVDEAKTRDEMYEGSEETDDDDDDDIRSELSCSPMESSSLLEPLKILNSLSGYQHLFRLYWILVTLPVSSCSAERAFSRLRIIKNRLRSTMCDDWMKALMVLACERDILHKLSNESIINSFSSLSNVLKRQLSIV
jgi:hypothetical protein